MSRSSNVSFVTIVAAAVLTLTADKSAAATITPASTVKTIGIGESFTVNKSITLDATAASRADIFLLADNTGSMGGIIGGVRSSATSILSSLQSTITDVAFGVGRYLGDPSEGVTPAGAYELQQPISTNSALSLAEINTWFAAGGGDFPEANFFALHQVATSGAATAGGLSTGQVTGWRPGAARVLIWFGDAPSHTATVTQAAAIAALTNNNIIVAALNTASAGGGIDSGGQASAIVAATSGVITNNNNPAGVAAAILSAVGTVTSTINLTFMTSATFPGLGVSFACTDPLGCMAVPGGATRQFSVTFTGIAPGTYEFDIFANGVAATEHDIITVADVPEPATFGLAGGALLAGYLMRRRRSR